jgi:hypothetical protein
MQEWAYVVKSLIDLVEIVVISASAIMVALILKGKV